MKNISLKIILITVFSAWSAFAWAQECLTTGTCPVSTSQYPATTQSTSSSTFTQIANDMFAGEFARCNVTAGVTYQWSLCTADGGASSYDSELTLFHGTTNARICYSDDVCGTAPKIGWTATFTGTVKIQINEFGCDDNTINTTLVWRTAPSGSDAALGEVYTLGTIATSHSNPHVVSAVVTNTGTTAFSNLPVTLNVTGANSFSNVQTIPSLAPGASVIVNFTGYSSINLGNNTVTVSLPTDSNPANNLKTVTQAVTSATLGYGYGTTASGGAGFNTGTGEVAVKFNAASGATLLQVKPNFNTAGKVFRVRIFSASGTGGTPGTLLYTSSNQTSVLGANTVTISPALSIPTTFYVAIQQVTAADNMSLSYQTEDPLRANTFYANTNLTTPSWSDLSPGVPFRIMVDAVLSGGSSGSDAGVSEVYTLGTISTAHSNPHIVSARITNTGTTALTNVPVTLTVSGANTFSNTQTIPSLAIGASVVVNFTAYSSTTLGNNTVVISVPTDSNPSNNTKTVTQAVTAGSLSYAYDGPATGGAGFNTGTGEVAIKFNAAAGATLLQVKPTFNAAGKVFKVRVFDASGTGGLPGTLLHTSANQTSVLGANTVTISPTLSVPTTFYVAIQQVTAGDNMSLSYQTEDPLRANTFFSNTNITTPAWVDLSPGVTFRNMVEAVLSSCAVPAQAAAISGPASICGTAAVTYTVPAVTGATSYTWTLPGGWTGTSTTNSITATPTATSGTVSVTANNACGSGTPQSLAVTISPGAPAQPGAIAGNAAACAGVATTYSVTPVAGASTYTWTLPSGWSGTSTTNSISASAGTSGGTITVVASNGCGTSTAQTLTVTANVAPATPAAISGNTTVCQNSTNLYTVPAVAGATSYIWTLPAGWTGSSTSNTINVTAGASSGTISVVASNSCGNSASSLLVVNMNSVPSQPAAITGPANVCQSTTGTYTVAAVPGATSYNWTLPTGWTGSSTSNSITATAGSAPGNISVSVTNSCGTSPAQTLAVTSTTGTPAQPGTISGSATVCPGGNVTYSVTPVTGAASYTWTLPGGWTGTSTTNSINAVAGTTPGSVTVIANNGCGTSPAQTLPVVVSSITQPGAITGSATAVCQGASATYTVPAVAGATTYNWTLPGSWTGTSTTNSITVTAGTTGGPLTVTATDGSCTSPAQTINLTVNALPPVPTISTAGGVLASSAATGNQWNLNGAPLTGATAQFFTPTQNGFYTVVVTNASGCSATSATFSVTAVGLAEAFANGIQLKVYPNPASEMVNIEAYTDQEMQVAVIDIIGKVVLRAVAAPSSGKLVYTLNTSSFSKGVYQLNLTSKSGSTVRRLVIQ